MEVLAYPGVLDPLVELLADLVERGELTVSGARAVRDLGRARTSGLDEED